MFLTRVVHQNRGTLSEAAARLPSALCALALACVSALGVLVGGALGQYLPLEWIKRVAAVGFIVIGALMLMGKF